MRPLNRGFVLVELLLGLVVLGIFAMTLVALVRGTAKVATRATQALLADRAVLALRVFAEADLANAAVGDVVVLAPARIALSRPIGDAIVCSDSAGAVLLADNSWSGSRTPQGARDDLLLLLDAVAATWQRVPIDSVTRTICPSDGSPATRLVVAAHGGAAIAARVLEPVELSAYLSSAADWFGLTPASHASVVQPFAGPLVPAATRFVLGPDHLDVTVPPRGAGSTVVQVPLGITP